MSGITNRFAAGFRDRWSDEQRGRTLRRALRVLGQREPLLDGALSVEGTSSEVIIRRDGNGVPHIDAASDRDAWFGLGFVVAQDRCFQMEFYRRAVGGTMAAAVGSSGLRHDRLVRRIGYRRSAVAHLAALDQPTRDLLCAYAEGVGAGMHLGRTKRPHELALLRLQPVPWTAVDVLAFMKLITASMGTNWDAELARLVILQRDGASALDRCDLGYDPSHPFTADVSPVLLDELALDLAEHRHRTSAFGASNNWSVSGARTASGSPIVANDPHLNPQVPSQWYLAHIRTPEWECAGATLVGAPGFIAGHNGHVAWGVTSARADLSDLAVEQLTSDGTAVRRGDHNVPCEIVSEVIEVRGRAPVVERVVITDTGPVISPVLEDDPTVISLRATWLGHRPMRGFFDAGTQRTVAGLVECFRSWNGPSVNLVAADDVGTIGWKFVGTVPDRVGGPSYLPTKGADLTSAWKPEPIPFEELPSAIDPADGLIATANNRPTPGPESDRLGDEWSDGYRVERIRRRLAERDDWKVEDMLALQLDRHAGPWETLRDHVLGAGSGDPDVDVAIAALGEWNGWLDGDSSAATIYELMLHNIRLRVARCVAPRSWRLAMGEGVHDLSPFNGLAVRGTSLVTRLLRDRPDGWVDVDWDDLVRRALSDAVSELRERRGPDPRRWAWGDVRPLRLQHLLSDVPVIGPSLGLGPIAVGGDLNTVGMCASAPLDPFAAPVATATMRMVVEVGRWDEAVFVLAGGQSGNPTSVHYDDQLQAWQHGAGVPIPWAPERVDAVVEHTLRLTPRGHPG